MKPRLQVIYHVQSEAHAIEARAQSIAVEQSVEMPVAAIEKAFVRAEIIGRVEAVRELTNKLFEVRISLAQDTVGNDPGQLLNMVFGNSSLQPDVILQDVDLPVDLVDCFAGPRHGLEGLRERAGAYGRALTCSALKPQGLPPTELAQLASRFALGGIDYIKDDHGLANQVYSPFRLRIEAVAEALARNGREGRLARYVPSLSGDLDQLRAQIEIAAAAGLDAVMVAPMIIGLSNFHRLVRDSSSIAFIAHPSMAGASRIAPALLLGKIFRILGADAVVFPNYGGRFGYTPDTCRMLARRALEEQGGLRPALPVPAGGMTRSRVPEMLDFYGADVMLLIGGALLETGAQLVGATAAFVADVQNHAYGQAR